MGIASAAGKCGLDGSRWWQWEEVVQTGDGGGREWQIPGADISSTRERRRRNANKGFGSSGHRNGSTSAVREDSLALVDVIRPPSSDARALPLQIPKQRSRWRAVSISPCRNKVDVLA
jgi:hypothetical protein